MAFAIRTYWRLIAIQIRSQAQYRVAFAMDVVTAAVILGLFFVALVFVFQRFENIAGWTLGEVAFLYGMVEMAFGTMDMVFSGFDPNSFGQQVRRGTFDQLLLRPLSLTLQVLGSQFVIRRLGRILQGVAIFVVALSLTDITWTAAKLLYLPVVWASL
ncbi:MAG: ABC-2 family transporter protein, partial [Chloroflexota bacterium]